MLARTIKLVSMLTILIATSVCVAQRPGFQTLQVVIDRPIFDEIVQLLNLDEQQEQIAESLYQDYFNDLAALDSSVKKQQWDVGEREMAEMLETLPPLPQGLREDDLAALEKAREREKQHLELTSSERYLALRLAAVRVNLIGQAEADVLLTKFCDGLQLILNDEQASMGERILPLVRRRVLLWKPSAGRRDFWGHVDLLLLVQTAQRFECASFDPHHPSAEPERIERFQSILKQYETDMDTRLMARIMEMRLPRRAASLRTIQMTDIAPDQERLIRKQGQTWSSLFDVNRAAAEQIRMLLQETSEHDAAQWWQRFQAAYAPELFRSDDADRFLDWLRARADATQQQHEEAERLFESYTIERARLRDETFNMAADFRRLYGSIDVPGRRYEARQKMYQQLRERCALAVQSLEGLLDQNQAATWKAVK